MRFLVMLIWAGSVLAGLFWQPLITAITTIALATMLLCVVLVLLDAKDALGDIRDALDQQAESIETTELEPKILERLSCPNCSESNPVGRELCWNCNAAL